MVELFVDTGTMAEMNDYRSRMLYERPSAEYRQKTTQHCTNYLWQWKIAGCSAVSDLSLFVGEKTVETVMDILEFGRIVGVGDEAVVKYFQDKHLLRKAVQCQPCGRDYSLIKKKDSVSGFEIRCSGWRKKESLSKNSFFDGSHLPLPKIFGLVYFWTAKTSSLQATYHTSVSNTTTIQWYQYLRDICSWKLLRRPLVLGDVDRCVQIDESVTHG